MEKKKVGIIGYGGMGSWHAKHIMRSDTVELGGIVDIKAERRQLAEERGIHVYASKEELFNDPEIEIVTIATPNELHKILAIEALKNGKNVISEKPATLSCADFGEMTDASKKYGRLLTVHQNRRWDPEYLMMKKVYDSGNLGDVTSVCSIVHGSRGIPGDWRKEKARGGGMILDWGVHLIDQILCIVCGRRIEEVYCRCFHITNDQVDDGFNLKIYFENDLTATVEVGTSNFISMPRFYMTGTEGSAIIDDWKCDCRVVCCKHWNEKDVVPVVSATGMTKTMAPRNENTVETEIIPLPEVDVHDFYRNFCAAIDGREEQIVTHKQVMRVMSVMEAAFKSDAERNVVRFEDKYF